MLGYAEIIFSWCEDQCYILKELMCVFLNVIKGIHYFT